MCKEKEITVLKVSPHKKPEVVTLKKMSCRLCKKP